MRPAREFDYIAWFDTWMSTIDRIILAARADTADNHDTNTHQQLRDAIAAHDNHRAILDQAINSLEQPQ